MAFNGDTVGLEPWGVGIGVGDRPVHAYGPARLARGLPDGQTGAVTAIQRANSDLRLSPHFHTLFLDRLFGPDRDGKGYLFHPAPAPSQEEIEQLVQPIRIVLDPDERPLGKGALCGQSHGFNLQGATRVAANDKQGRERLCRYILRPPLANDRLSILDDGDVRLGLKRPGSDGTSSVQMPPLVLIARLAALVGARAPETCRPLPWCAFLARILAQRSGPHARRSRCASSR